MIALLIQSGLCAIFLEACLQVSVFEVTAALSYPGVHSYDFVVILDSHPLVIIIVIISGWAAKTAVANFVGSWVGGDEAMGEAWLAYSIP